LPGWLLEFQELDLKVLCRKYVTRLGPRLGYREVSLYLHDARHGLLTLAGATHTRSIDLTVPLNAGDQYLMAAIARDGRVMRTDEIGPELAKRGIARRPDRPYQDGKCLVAPLVSEGRLWGVLNLSGCLRTPLTELGLPLDEILAFLGRALHHACAYEEARTEARVDGLTGLYNQRWMLEALAKEIRRAQRFATPLSVLMIDLDGLKSVNDREGHAAGDCLLRHVAARIAAVLRQFDGAARVGGDEFVAMLPGTSLQGAQQVARRLLHSVREDPPRFRATPLEITASIGAVEWRDGWDARQLLDAADQAMYRAKEQGRDTLVCEPIDRPPIVRVGSCVSSDAGASATTRFSGPEQSAPKAVPTTPAEVRPPRAMDSSACGVRPSGATSSEHE
jgi:diguanylate cyclase (GGDEF)-like protein